MADEEKELNRLNDIQVEEVSLVDHPANKRRFVLIKRNTHMDDLLSDGKGGFVRAAKAKASPFPPPKGGKPTVEETEKELFSNDDDAPGKPLKKADVSGAALAEEMAAHLNALEELLEELAMHEEEEPSDLHMKKCMKLLEKMNKTASKYGAAKTEKAGKKLSTAHEQTFKQVVAPLQALLAEMLETPAKAKEHLAQPGDSTVKPNGWSESNPSMVPSGTMGAPSMKQLEKAMSSKMDELVSVVKRQEKEIERLKSSTVSSNALPIEKASTGDEDNVYWPMDMNYSADRSKIDKAFLF